MLYLLLSSVFGISCAVQAKHSQDQYRGAVYILSNGSHSDGGGSVFTETCMEPGKLKFVHVMKTGGISVDEYLWCRCKQEKCSVSRHEGRSSVMGDTSCEQPSVCTSHSPPWQMYQECGDFTKARVFTLLREPVSRVVSFYNYMRFPRPEDSYPGYRPYQQMSLTAVLNSWGKVDLNIDQPKASSNGGCVMCAAQLSNAMVLRHFASEASLAAQSTWPIKAGVVVPPSETALRYQLAEAKKVLARMDAVFVDVGTFKEAFERDDLLTPGRAVTPTTCEVPLANPSPSKIDPTDSELELIRQLNWADEELYKYAQTLPNLRS
eukprot:TRINITY_DN6316_c0_g1_i1.p1 TRINITY_DN6316_c0_g1~~TRINITY_DN6316_c0_g1_i1.p1  ORF type:complete len:357 (+),score=53.65 TRINITY_DN6316_c0_g1_i1:111-1073(+)